MMQFVVEPQRFISINNDKDSVPIYVMNLKEQTNRYESIKNQFEDAKIFKYFVFESINGRHLLETNPEYCKTLMEPGVFEMILSGNRAYDCDHVYGSFGCYLSHLSCWIHALHVIQSNDPVLIFEDDVAIPNDLLSKIDFAVNFVENTDKDWDILNIGNRNLAWGNQQQIGTKLSGYKIIRPTYFTSLGAYLIKKDSIKKILDFMFPIRYQLDWQLAFHRDNYNLYCLDPFIVNLTQLYKDSVVNHVSPVGEKEMKRILGEEISSKMDLRDVRNINYETKDKILFPKNWFIFFIIMTIICCILFLFSLYLIIPEIRKSKKK